MLTSKEVIEGSGISRATLNNYISAGLVARPEVLPPAAEDGAAPRIGYFPDDTLDRIHTIQKLKRQGWSMSRITQHFAQGGTGTETATPPTGSGSAASNLLRARPELQDAGNPAYLVDERFVLVWRNASTGTSPLSPLSAMNGGESVLRHLLAANVAGAHSILRFHLGVAKDRGVSFGQLATGFAPDETSRLRQVFDEVRGAGPVPIAHTSVAATGGVPLRLGFAVHFREHVLFAYAPAPAGGATVGHARPAAAAPTLGSVAVLVASLHDSTGLWARLSAHEYFELANEVASELEAIFRRHRAVMGRHPGEGLVCYFLRDADDGHLGNALAAARAARDAMRALSRRWQQRKHWDVELAMDIGIDEGQEWMGAIGGDELRVLGEAADRAEQLSRCSRGTILVTRGFIGKLPPHEGAQVSFAAPRTESHRGRAAMHTFAPLGTICPGVPARLADVPVAEVFDPPAAAD